MEITIIITGGLVMMTLIGVIADYLGKKKKGIEKGIESKLGKIEQRISVLEAEIQEKDERVKQLEGEMSFINKLIEDKTKSKDKA